MDLYFATGNAGKVDDAQAIVQDENVNVQQLNVEIVEPCLESLEEIAAAKVEQAVAESQLWGAHIMADDSGLFVNALDGFPGQHTAFFDRTAGKEKLLDLLREEDDMSAEFRAAIAIRDPDTGEIKTFSGQVAGTIVEPRGDDGFGYDPMFLPDGHDKTFAEDTEYKHQVSHRNEALENLKAWMDTSN